MLSISLAIFVLFSQLYLNDSYFARNRNFLSGLFPKFLSRKNVNKNILSSVSIFGNTEMQLTSSIVTNGSVHSLPPYLLEIRNKETLEGLNIEKHIILLIIQDSRMRGVDIEERAKELREVIGLTRSNLKKYIQRYPTLAIEMFTNPVKSVKSVVMRTLEITETEYLAAIKKIQKQTNNKSGPLFRGSFSFLTSVLKEELNLSLEDLQHIFRYYPTIFTFDEKHVRQRLIFMKSVIGYSEFQLKELLRLNARCLFYDNLKYIQLSDFFTSYLQLSIEDFRALTSSEPRLIVCSLNDTIFPKALQLETLWGYSRTEISHMIQYAPTILTTPVETSQQLWEYFQHELKLNTTAIYGLSKKWPGLLRCSAITLAQKIEYLTLAQLLLKYFDFSMRSSSSTVPIDIQLEPILLENHHHHQFTTTATTDNDINDSSKASLIAPIINSHNKSENFLVEEEHMNISVTDWEDIYLALSRQQLLENSMTFTLSKDRIQERLFDALPHLHYNKASFEVAMKSILEYVNTVMLTNTTTVNNLLREDNDENKSNCGESIYNRPKLIAQAIFRIANNDDIILSVVNDATHRCSTKLALQWNGVHNIINQSSQNLPLSLQTIFLSSEKRFDNWKRKMNP